MTEEIRQIHNVAMDLADLARFSKDKDVTSYLKAAYELELYAALRIKTDDNANNQIWRATLIRSAGWLALKCGYYEQAKSLAQMSLDIPTDDYSLGQLEDLKSTALEKLSEKTLKKPSSLVFLIHGYLASANMDTNEINIREKGTKKPLTLLVSKSQIKQVVRFFLETDIHF